MTKRSRVPLENTRIQLILECQTTPRNILVFQMGNWMLKANMAKIQSERKTSTSLSYFDVKKKKKKNYTRHCTQPLFCWTAHTKHSIHVLVFVLLQRGSGNGWITKAEKWLSTKKKSVMKITTQTKKLSVGSRQGSKERTTRQQLPEKCSPDNQLINIVCAWWNEKVENIKGKKEEKTFW